MKRNGTLFEVYTSYKHLGPTIMQHSKIENECHQHPWVLHPSPLCNVSRRPAADLTMKEHQSARAERWDGKHNPTIHFLRFEYISEAAGRDASLL